MELFSRLYVPFIPDEFNNDVESLFDKWRIDHVDRDPENKYDNPEGRGSFNFRTALASLLWQRAHSTSKDLVSPEHEDKAIRLGFFSACRPQELLGGYADLKNSEKVSQVCKNFFERDGNEFIEALISNENFWTKDSFRQLIHDLAWHLADDPNHYLDVPNLYRGRESYYRDEKPEYFADEDNWMSDEIDIAQDEYDNPQNILRILNTRLANIEQKIRRPAWTTAIVLMIFAAAVGRWLAN